MIEPPKVPSLSSLLNYVFQIYKYTNSHKKQKNTTFVQKEEEEMEEGMGTRCEPSDTL